MVQDVVMLQRLLDQQQVELVQFGQVVGVGQVIDAVGIHLELELGPGVAHGARRFDVPTGLDLELDTLVAVPQVGVDHLEQGVDVLLDADADADGHTVARAAQHLGEAYTARLAKEVPRRKFQPGLGHAVAAHFGKRGRDIFRSLQVGFEQHGGQKILLDGPDGVGVFFVVKG